MCLLNMLIRLSLLRHIHIWILGSDCMLVYILANIHQCLSKFESSMRANDLRGAAEHVAHLRGEHVAHLREHSLMRDTTLLESICSKAESCEEQLCLSLRDAWAKAALGFAREDDAVSEDSLVLDSMAGRLSRLKASSRT